MLKRVIHEAPLSVGSGRRADGRRGIEMVEGFYALDVRLNYPYGIYTEGVITRLGGRRMGNGRHDTLSSLEYHVLLALARGALYGYALKEAVVEESGGALKPRAGSLYRVLARMMSRGFVEEVASRHDGPHPGLERRYYGLRPLGRKALKIETVRRRRVAALAERRLGLT
jgi:PadR family transcriptional regulator PadR